MRKCSDCQTVIAAAHEVDDVFHGVDPLLIPQPLKRALERMCLALDYLHEEGRPQPKFLDIVDLIKEGQEQGRTGRKLDEPTKIIRLKGPLTPQQQARKLMKERARARKELVACTQTMR